MKVCFVTSVFPRFDSDTEVPWLREMVKRTREKGIDIHILAPSFRALKSHAIDGIPVHRFRYFFGPWETLTGEEGAPNRIHRLHYKIITLFYILFGSLALVRLHLKEKFDIIHVHWPFPHTFFAIAALAVRKAKLVLTFYGAELLLINKFGFVKKYLADFIKRANAVIAISNFTASKVKAIRDCEVTVIPYGAAIRTKPSSSKKKTDERIIISVGRMIERKGFEYAIRAMPQVIQSISSAKLYLVGGGPEQDRLKSIINEIGVDKSTILTGKISNEDLADLFAQSEVFIIPSIVDSKGDTEGLGVVILEAIMYGKPVIGTNVGGIPDVIINERTGLLVPQKDPQELALAIVKILSDPLLAKRLADEGYRHVKEKFDWEVIVGNLIAVYNKLMR